MATFSESEWIPRTRSASLRPAWQSIRVVVQLTAIWCTRSSADRVTAWPASELAAAPPALFSKIRDGSEGDALRFQFDVVFRRRRLVRLWHPDAGSPVRSRNRNLESGIERRRAPIRPSSSRKGDCPDATCYLQGEKHHEDLPGSVSAYALRCFAFRPVNIGRRR